MGTRLRLFSTSEYSVCGYMYGICGIPSKTTRHGESNNRYSGLYALSLVQATPKLHLVDLSVASSSQATLKRSPSVHSWIKGVLSRSSHCLSRPWLVCGFLGTHYEPAAAVFAGSCTLRVLCIYRREIALSSQSSIPPFVDESLAYRDKGVMTDQAWRRSL